MEQFKMTSLLLRKDHITFTSGNDMTEICKPLLKLGIISFNYVRTFDDGSQINLSNIPSWLEHFYENEYYTIGAFERHPSHYESGFALWPQLSGQKIFYDAREYFNIDHGITIVEKQKDSCDFYYFGTTKDNYGILNLYLNHMDLLKRFIFYFKEKAEYIVKQANMNRIILPNHFELHESPDVTEQYYRLKTTQEFLKETSIKKFPLSGELEGNFLSNKQLNCMIYLIEGKTAKEIGKLLHLSHRTIEGHINNLKNRFNCKSKSQLIDKLMQGGLR